jgi:LysR family glycine cleavage system transcriptional activator
MHRVIVAAIMNLPPSRNRHRGQGKLGVEAPRLPSLVAIRVFESAARHGSFAAAAQELDTTAASVSYHVRRLERQIGVELFLRHAQRVELTAPGRLIAAQAADAFAILRAGFIKARDIDESNLALTTLPTFGTSWLSPRLGKFRALYPEIKLDVDLSVQAQDLATGRFDVAIRNGHGRWPGMRSIELFPAIFMPLCAPALKDAARGIADPAAPLGVPLLGRPDWWTMWYEAAGHAASALANRFGTSYPNEHLDIAAAIAGHGVAIGSPILFGNELDAGKLVPAHDFVAADGRAFWLVFPAARESRPKISSFREWLCDEAADCMRRARNYVRKAVPAPGIRE